MVKKWVKVGANPRYVLLSTVETAVFEPSVRTIFSKDPYASKNILLYLVQKIICFSPLYLGLAPTFPHFFTMTDFDDILPQKQSETETNEF